MKWGRAFTTIVFHDVMKGARQREYSDWSKEKQREKERRKGKTDWDEEDTSVARDELREQTVR